MVLSRLRVGYKKHELAFNCFKYKTLKHGLDHGLPKKSDANIIAVRDSLVDMLNNLDIVWYTDGQYQGGTPRRYDCVNIFDPDTNLITVYQKQPDESNLFLTTCRLIPLEVKNLNEW
jgi:hypothetical protein